MPQQVFSREVQINFMSYKTTCDICAKSSAYKHPLSDLESNCTLTPICTSPTELTLTLNLNAIKKKNRVRTREVKHELFSIPDLQMPVFALLRKGGSNI